LPQCRLDILQSKLELVRIELLGTGAETMAHEGIDDRLKPLDLGVRLAFGQETRVNRRSAVLSGAGHHERGASPNPPAKRRAGPR